MYSKVHVLETWSSVLSCWEVGPNGRCLSCGGITLMNGVMPLLRKSVYYDGSAIPLPPTCFFSLTLSLLSSWHGMMQQKSLCQNLAPWSWPSPSLTLRNKFVNYKLFSLWYFIIVTQNNRTDYDSLKHTAIYCCPLLKR